MPQCSVSHFCRSCAAQHFGWINDGCADEPRSFRANAALVLRDCRESSASPEIIIRFSSVIVSSCDFVAMVGQKKQLEREERGVDEFFVI